MSISRRLIIFWCICTVEQGFQPQHSDTCAGWFFVVRSWPACVGCPRILAATHWMPGALYPVVTTKNVFRHVQMFLGGQNRPRLRTNHCKGILISIKKFFETHHSCNGCFLEGAVTWNLLASAFGAPGKKCFTSDRIIYISFLWNLQHSRSSYLKVPTSWPQFQHNCS